MRGLGEHAVISAEIASTMGKAAGFRNLLVHQYGDIDDDVVVAYLSRLGDLEQFVREVLEWTNRNTVDHR